MSFSPCHGGDGALLRSIPRCFYVERTLAGPATARRYPSRTARVAVDPQTHELSIASAGHLPPVLRKKSGETFVLGSQITGIPLGIMPDSIYEQATISLAPGDMVVVYTDGITEAMNTQNEIFGRERLEDCLEPIDAGPYDAIRSLIEATNAYSSNQPIRDDRCLVAFRFIPDSMSLDGATMF